MASTGLRLQGDILALRRKLKRLTDVEINGANTALAEGLRTSTRQRFKVQKSPEGKAWKPSQRAMRTNGATLTQSAGLKNSIRSKVSATGFAVGTNKIYARAHQFGLPSQKITIRAKTASGLVFKMNGRWIRKQEVTIRRSLPARPFMGLSEEDLLVIKETLEKIVSEE